MADSNPMSFMQKGAKQYEQTASAGANGGPQMSGYQAPQMQASYQAPQQMPIMSAIGALQNSKKDDKTAALMSKLDAVQQQQAQSQQQLARMQQGGDPRISRGLDQVQGQQLQSQAQLASMQQQPMTMLAQYQNQPPPLVAAYQGIQQQPAQQQQPYQTNELADPWGQGAPKYQQHWNKFDPGF